MGLLDSFEKQITNPLLLGGAALVSGDGFSGMQRGMSSGFGYQQQQAKQAEAERQRQDAAQQRQRWTDYTTSPGFGRGMPQGMPDLIRAAGPQGMEIAGKAMLAAPSQQIAQQRLQLAQAAEARQAQVTQAQLQQIKNRTPEARAAVASQYGLQPGTPEYQSFVLTGTVPQQRMGNQPVIKTLKEGEQVYAIDPRTGQSVQVAGGPSRKTDVATNLQRGLSEAATIPQRYDAFDNATGEWRSSDSWMPGPLLARAWGSLSSALEMDRTSPGETRRAIEGSIETLSASIKPLIRKPGEGSWTDADQARLVSIVGPLTKANNKSQYYRALQEVRRRISANFGMDIAKIQNIPRQYQESGQADGQAAARVQSIDEARRLPSGTVFIDPAGVMRRVP